MNLTLSKTFTFDAAHHLPKAPEGHKCRRPHGHTWTCTITVAPEFGAAAHPDLDARGWIIDYADLQAVWNEYVHQHIDHRDLNEVEGIDNPTTENLVQYIAAQLGQPLREREVVLVSVALSESTGNRCTLTL